MRLTLTCASSQWSLKSAKLVSEYSLLGQHIPDWDREKYSYSPALFLKWAVGGSSGSFCLLGEKGLLSGILRFGVSNDPGYGGGDLGDLLIASCEGHSGVEVNDEVRLSMS